MIIKFELNDNPYATSQEKGIRVVGGKPHFYEKPEVLNMRYVYEIAIRRYMRVYNLHIPHYTGAIALKVIFTFKTPERRKWGLLKTTKPDNDNAVKLLQDVLAEELGFHDAQIATLNVAKFWGEKAGVCIEIEEVPIDLYRVKR